MYKIQVIVLAQLLCSIKQQLFTFVRGNKHGMKDYFNMSDWSTHGVSYRGVETGIPSSPSPKVNDNIEWGLHMGENGPSLFKYMLANFMWLKRLDRILKK